MESSQLIGFLAALFITIANVPQAYVIIREKSVKHISVVTYFVLLIGTSLWVTYGIIKNDWPIILSNGISVITSALILCLNFCSSKAIDKLHEKILPKTVKDKVRRKHNKSKTK